MGKLRVGLITNENFHKEFEWVIDKLAITKTFIESIEQLENKGLIPGYFVRTLRTCISLKLLVKGKCEPTFHFLLLK